MTDTAAVAALATLLDNVMRGLRQADTTPDNIAKGLLSHGVTSAPLGAAPSEAAIAAAMTPGNWEEGESPVREAVRRALTAAYAIDGVRPVLPEGDRAPEDHRDCPMCGDPGGYGHVCPERSN